MSNTSHVNEVALQFGLEGANLEIGQASHHFVCPMCSGGSSHERTFVLRKMTHDLIFFRCYRDSCGARGTFSISGGQMVKSSEVSQKREVVYKEGSFELLTDDQKLLVSRKCSTNLVQLVSVGVKVDEYSKRIMFPLFDTEHEQKGWVLRYYEGVSEGEPKPKSKTVWFDSVHRICLTSRRRVATKYSKCIVLVEDWPSANRITDAGVPAGAILGTGLSLDVLQPLVVSGYDRVILCLDADAKATALKHKLRFSSLFCNFSLYLLSNKDVKDMNKDEFTSYISSIYNILDI